VPLIDERRGRRDKGEIAAASRIEPENVVRLELEVEVVAVLRLAGYVKKWPALEGSSARLTQAMMDAAVEIPPVCVVEM